MQVLHTAMYLREHCNIIVIIIKTDVKFFSIQSTAETQYDTSCIVMKQNSANGVKLKNTFDPTILLLSIHALQ